MSRIHKTALRFKGKTAELTNSNDEYRELSPESW
jgi:hypothetical protein